MKKVHLFLIAAFAAVLVFCIGWGLVSLYASQHELPKGVHAGHIDIGGMEIDAAKAKLNQAWDNAENRAVAVEAVNGKAIRWRLADIGYRMERKDALEAIDRLTEGGLWARATARLQFPKRLEAAAAWEEGAVKRAARAAWDWLDAAGNPANAVRTITPDDRVVYRPHAAAYRIDYDALEAAIRREAETQGVVADKGDEHGEGAVGKQVNDAPSQLRVRLPFREVLPDVTLEKLQAEGVERLIQSFSTSLSGSSAGRRFNVIATARTLNEWTLAPGEVFDYAKVVKAVEMKYGFREAPVILNGRLVPGIGGGICQVSSTLYNAALRAGLEITERRNHSLPVSYLPKGQDATFAEGAINFRFKNTTGKHLVIKSAVEDGRLTVKLFGTMPRNVRYDIASQTVEVLEPPVREVPTAGMAPGSRTVVEPGRAGYVVETYRTLVRDGAAVSRERVSRDTYRAQPTVVYVGGGGGSGAGEAHREGPGGSGGARGARLLEDGVRAE